MILKDCTEGFYCPKGTVVEHVDGLVADNRVPVKCGLDTDGEVLEEGVYCEKVHKKVKSVRLEEMVTRLGNMKLQIVTNVLEGFACDMG